MRRKEIVIRNQSVAYTLRRVRRSKTMRLVVHEDGSVELRIPRYVTVREAEQFVQEKADWIISSVTYFKQLDPGPVRRFTRADYLKHKDEAARVIAERVAHFNTIYTCTFNRVSVRDQKTRWGSCSAKGNLNFNYKLLFLPERLRDYIIVHELCHLKQLNHSKKFWDLVSLAFPDHKTLRRELREQSYLLR